MARKESPAHHLAAIAAIAVISLVLAQTITDRLPSNAFVTRHVAERSCESSAIVQMREGLGSLSRPSSGAEATGVRASCFQPRK